jgi:hypothetical protein
MAGMEITPELAEKVLRGGPDAIAVVRGIYQTHVEKLDALESEARKIRDAAAMLPLVWIPVEEQWPKHGSDVLVAYKAGKYVLLGVGEFDGTTVNDGGVTVPYFKGIGGFEVTHWQPLPPPPDCTPTGEK